MNEWMRTLKIILTLMGGFTDAAINWWHVGWEYGGTTSDLIIGKTCSSGEWGCTN